jgi:hypothetical protein
MNDRIFQQLAADTSDHLAWRLSLASMWDEIRHILNDEGNES